MYESGITNILIIEAQDYIGGRTKSVEFANYTLNIGASWITGACIDENITDCLEHQGRDLDNIDIFDMNPMLELANLYGIPYEVSDWYDDSVLIEYGTKLKNYKLSTEDAFKEFWEAQDCVDELVNMESISEDISYFAALYMCGWRRPHDGMEKTAQWMNYEMEFAEHARWTSAYGSANINDWNGSSLVKYGGQELFVMGQGYQAITTGLAADFINIEDLDNEEKIILNSPVVNIEYDENVMFCICCEYFIVIYCSI